MKRLTFSERHGYVELPKSMKIEELSDDLRRELWDAIVENYRMAVSYSLHLSAYGRAVVALTRQPLDELGDHDAVGNWMRELVLNGKFHEVLSFLEALTIEMALNHQDWRILQAVRDLFQEYSAPYVLNDNFQFLPRSSREQGKAVDDAITTLGEANMSGAAKHLHDAAAHMNARQYADSIADSIRAVESVARVIEPGTSTLGKALDALQRKGVLKNAQLKSALGQLYAYTNSEQGIRHALTNQSEADVGLDEAMFMFGACASFAAYLTSKHEKD